MLGLYPPEPCRLQKEAHRREMDPLAEFWDDCIMETGSKEDTVSTRQMQARYTRWASATGVPDRDRATKTGLTRYANRRSKGAEFWSVNTGGGRGFKGWRGLKLADWDDVAVS